MHFHCYQVRHSTVYDYSARVTEAEHLAKLQPRNLVRQRCLSHELSVDPACDLRNAYLDYFGNHTVMLAPGQAHQHFEVTARSRVAVGLPYIPDFGETPAWETVPARILKDGTASGLEAVEHTYDSSLVRTSPEILDYATRSFPIGRPILEAGIDLTQRIFADFAFDPSATSVTTPVSEFFERRCGVCQDFAQFQIACFRSLGLAARYVSGYLETEPPPGAAKLIGADASHAWVSMFCPEIGWIDLDPTNGCLPSMRHITIGWGRDYLDICPLRGVIHGGGEHVLKVAVDVIADGSMEDPNATEH